MFDCGQRENQKVVFRVSTNGQKVQLDSMGLLRHIVAQAESLRDDENDADEVVRFKTALNETVAEGLRQANSGGIGSNLRRTRGEEFYTSQVELIADYLFPKLLKLWLKSGESHAQRVVDRLASAPMVLKVDGQRTFSKLNIRDGSFTLPVEKYSPKRSRTVT